MYDNICAIATPYGVGAISVIRCSGENSIEIVNKIFKGKDLTKVNPNTINYGYIIYEGTIKEGKRWTLKMWIAKNYKEDVDNVSYEIRIKTK